MAVIVR